jgi:branched-chain amino acid transport system permease protein
LPSIVAFLVLVGIGIAVYLANDGLTQVLFDLDTTWLFLIAVVVATLVGAGLGGLMEAALIRPLYERHVYQLMMTMGLGFIGIELVRAIWGRTQITMPKPSLFAGTGEGCPATSLGAWFQHHCSTLILTIQGETTRIRVYNEIFVILVGVLVLVVIWILLQRTRLGMIIRAGVQDSEMVEALGINVRQVFTLVFALGVATAALGGVLSGPSTGLTDAMGVHLLLAGLIALAIGGLTSYPGAALGSVIVGLLQQFIIKYGQIGIPLPFLEEPFKPSPPLVPASTVLLMVIVLLVVPHGLLGRKE